MSMLVGVRGQSRENEGAALREGIVQQPGPFYNGNPSSIIWGNSRTTPLWREDGAAPFSLSSSSVLGNADQLVQKEEKEKDDMVAGDGRTSSKGRRHVARTQLTRNLNPASSPSSPFAYGFPTQPPAVTSTPHVSEFHQFPTPSVLTPGSAFILFGSGINHNLEAFGANAPLIRPEASAGANDERMEDIEEMIPAMANLTMDYQPSDSKTYAKPDGSTSSVFARYTQPEWAIGSEVSESSRASRHLNAPDSSNDRKDAPGVFVFGAKSASNVPNPPPPKPVVVQLPLPSRSRTVKVKRIASGAKGKGVATGNETFSSPSPSSFEKEGLQSTSGECLSSEPTLAPHILLTGTAETSRADSALHDFASASSRIPIYLDSVAEEFHHSSSQAQSTFDSDCGNSFFTEIARCVDFSRGSDARPHFPAVAENLLKTNGISQTLNSGKNISFAPVSSRVSCNKGKKDESLSSTQTVGMVSSGVTPSFMTSKNVSAKREFAPGHIDLKSGVPLVKDRNSSFTQNMGVGSVARTDETITKSSAIGNSGKVFNTNSVESFQNETLVAPNLESCEVNIQRGIVDAKNLGESSSSPGKIVDLLKMETEPSIDVQKPAFHAFTHAQSEAFTTCVPSHPFVFGASHPQTSGSPRLETLSPPATVKFVSKAESSSPSVSKRANLSATELASELPGRKHAAPVDCSLSSQYDANALTSPFLSFNLGSPKPSVKEDCIFKSQGVSASAKMSAAPTLSVASGLNVKIEPDTDSISYKPSASHFVFSASSTSASPSEVTRQINSREKDTGDASARSGGESNENLKSVPADSPGTSKFLNTRSVSQANSPGSTSFEFGVTSSGFSGVNGKISARHKSHKSLLPASRRKSQSKTSSKEKHSPQTFMNFADLTSTTNDAGSPMDFSPQHHTLPHDSTYTVQNSKQMAWSWNQSMNGLDADDDWAQYSETDLPVENLRVGLSDMNLKTKQGGRTLWEGIGKAENDSFWWGGKESTGKSGGRKWMFPMSDESQDPPSERDNAWADIKVEAANEPGSAASSSAPSIESSASSSGLGQFTFTARSSPNLSSTPFIRRHAHKIQREKPGSGSTEVLKPASSKFQGETNLASSGGTQCNGLNAAPMCETDMKRHVSSFDTQPNLCAEALKGSDVNAGNWTSDQFKASPIAFSSRGNSWSTESTSALGSLQGQDGCVLNSSQTVGAAATEQVCERWRLRGNQAYANGDFPKAEEYYSRGASSVPPNETSQSCMRASMLCYSNRAATRMVVGRMREALADCTLAMAVDPNFLRVRLRAASCYLALGDTDSAVLAFKECIRRAKEDNQPDAKVSSEASEGLRKALQVDEYLELASQILANWTSGDTLAALRLLNEVLLSSPYSERALQLKGRALLLLRRYDEVVQLCEQSLVTAERNHPHSSADVNIHHMFHAIGGNETSKQGALSPMKFWRWQLIGKAKFHVGRLEESLEILQKLEEGSSVVSSEKFGSTFAPNEDSTALSIGSIRDLLRHKAAGNESFQNGKHTEAVEHYSAALACNGNSRPFNAVCFCNRAAASQALGNIGDAIADCSRAIALDPKYAKAISRRATLHEKVRDYGQSCHDLQRLITLLEGQQQQPKATLGSARTGRVSGNTQQDLRQARDRLEKAEDEIKKGHPLDHYMILGLEPGCSTNEIKKAYRKAALRHHPDKAGQFLSRSEGGDDSGLWKEVGDEVRQDAERLFKLIGEANAILSDAQKRMRYDAEEEFRKLRTRTNCATSGVSEAHRGMERGQGGAGRRPRDRWDTWNGYGHQHQRWQSGPDAAQPDTYARRGRYGSNNSSRSNGDGGQWTDYDWDDI